MFKWLHKFLYSDDEVVKLADGLSEFDAGSYQEMLASNGIVAMKKNMEGWVSQYGNAMTFSTNNFALYVKQSDVPRAIDILGPLLGGGKLAREASQVQEGRRRPRS